MSELLRIPEDLRQDWDNCRASMPAANDNDRRVLSQIMYYIERIGHLESPEGRYETYAKVHAALNGLPPGPQAWKTFKAMEEGR